MKVFWAVIAMISIGVGVYIAMDMNTKQQEVVKRVTTDGGPVLTITEPDTGITADDNTDERVASVAKRLPQGQAFIDLVNSLGSAVVTVVAIDESGIERASGTGFILSHNVVVACHLVVARGSGVRIHLSNGQNMQIESIIATDREYNLVLLKPAIPEHLDISKIKPLQLAETGLNKGDEVFLMARKLNQSQAGAMPGKVTSGNPSEEPDSTIGLDINLTDGSQTNPILNSDGDLVGVIAVSTIEEESQNLAIPVDKLRSLLNEAVSNQPVLVADYNSIYGPELAASDDRNSAELKLEATIVEQEDGSLLIDDRYIVKGKGTEDDPYRMTWDLLVSASRVYQPREGKNDLPERVTFLHNKWVKMSGYIAFPLMTQESDEILFMLNQWDGCCIGVPPTPFDAIEVRLAAPIEIEGGLNIFNYGSISGKIQVDPYVVNNWLVGLYLMEDATLELDM